MAHPLYVAFIWHQHQPIYKSPIGNTYWMPWVRLHGTKDYLDMAQLLARFPRLHQTINLVPSLLVQLQDYIDGHAFDPYLELLLKPVERLDAQQVRFAIERSFDAYHRTMVYPHPRYADLLEQREKRGVDWCVHHWTAADLSDVLAWFNLTWIDPLFRETDLEIAAWFAKGEGFSLGDRQRIYAKQREILAQIAPTHRQLQEKGQLELTTTPYTHPILPLLVDTHCARVAVPDLLLPGHRFQWETDLDLHFVKAKQIYARYFGGEPQGLWPSEQSVSPAMLPYVSRHGFRWLCSDEGVLGWSLGHYFRRDEQGQSSAPHLLYQPYRLETTAGDLAIVFRDRYLSDAIGFTYSNLTPCQAVTDFVDRLRGIYTLWQAEARDRPWLVTVALDGENCWEYYANDGKNFLELLYGTLSELDWLKAVTVSEFLQEFPPTEKIPPHQLHSGSWIDANFTTWIGDPIKNRAWELLAEARQCLARHPEATQENNPEVWEHLLAAEGSDWFWWFGAGHSSEHDAVFDRLFREHLQGIYQALNETVPQSLWYPLDGGSGGDRRPVHPIQPPIDGLGNPQAWEGAGCRWIGGQRGTMHQATFGQRLLYGGDRQRVYVRVDFTETGRRALASAAYDLHILCFYPEATLPIHPVPLRHLPAVSPLDYFFHHHVYIPLAGGNPVLYRAVDYLQWQPVPTHIQMGLADCLEVALPWEDLAPGSPLSFIVLLGQNGTFCESLSEFAVISLTRP
ncbi:MAG TPA: glycoside hydrolase [Cyanobacteria bacterium UBA8156]|nr:glycoside hydrolase [Cyanobacteria bacterium UBA8156]